MLDTFKAQLKAAAKTLGVTNLSNTRIDEYAAKLEKQNPNLATDDDHKEKVDAFLEIVDIKLVATYDDQQRTKAAKAKDETKKDDTKKSEEGTPNSDEQKTDDPDMPAWAKALMQQNQTLTEKLTSFEKEKAQITLREKVAGHEKLKGKVPQSFLNVLPLPEKEEDLDAFADEALTKYQAVLKDSEVRSPISRPLASGGTSSKEASAEEIEAIVSRL